MGDPDHGELFDFDCLSVVVDTAKGKDSTCTRICQEEVASRSRADDNNSFPKRVSL
jgi:hypothetical protein